MNEAPVTHRPKLIRTEFGFAVTDGLVSYPASTFNEGRELVKIATFQGMDAAGEYLYGPADYEEYFDEDLAFAQMLERRAENGTWWGHDNGDPDY